MGDDRWCRGHLGNHSGCLDTLEIADNPEDANTGFHYCTHTFRTMAIAAFSYWRYANVTPRVGEIMQSDAQW
jgi:hypothetical protein